MANIDPSQNKVVWVNSLKWTIGTDIWLFSENIDNYLGSSLNSAVLYFALRQINFSVYTSGTVIRRIQGSVLLNLKINWVSNPTIQKHFWNLLQ